MEYLLEKILWNARGTIISTVVGIVVALILTILLYVFILPDSKRNSLKQPWRSIHDILKIRGLMIEAIIRFLYVFCTVSSLISGFIMLFKSFGFGLLLIIVSPIVVRIIFEILMLRVLEVKNIIEINSTLHGNVDTRFSNVDIGEKLARGAVVVASSVSDAVNENIQDRNARKTNENVHNVRARDEYLKNRHPSRMDEPASVPEEDYAYDSQESDKNDPQGWDISDRDFNETKNKSPYIVCSNCGTAVYDGKFCPKCGNRLS